MLSRALNLSFRQLSCSSAVKFTTASAPSITNEQVVYDRDPAPYFFNDEVQNLLKTITRPIPEKVFRRRLDGIPLEPPHYEFMTDEQLQKAQEEANKFMWERLQIPPIVKIREEENRILSKNPELQGFTNGNIIFTDISYGISNKSRVIVVREANGNLRPAKHAERDRMNQIYFPEKDKEISMPKMFQDEHLQPILERGDYEFILNRACVQFDPDHADYHRVTKVTYDYINENMHHDRLRSTRHFGAMVFYLAWTKNIDNLLLENITTERLEDADLIVKLYYKLNPDENALKEKDPLKLLQYFIANSANSKRKLDHALKTYFELEAERRKLKADVNKAHGKESNSNEKKKNLSKITKLLHF